jgi:hypothetical protein
MFSLHLSEHRLSTKVCVAITLFIDLLFARPAWRQSIRIQNKTRHSVGHH